MTNKQQKKPEDCKDMTDIRYEIDRIDKLVISLLGERYNYVKNAAKFKTSETSVKAPERFKSMMEERRDWAEQEGLDSEMIETLYTDMINFFIAKEMDEWKKK